MLATELIDRSVYPTRLTQAGQIFYEQALTMLSQAHEARTLLRGHVGAPVPTIEFAVPHAVAPRIFRAGCSGSRRRWWSHAVARAERARCGAVARRGGCDLVMGYHHPSHPVALDPARYDMLILGSEPISPFSAPGAGRPRLPGTADARVPYLSYAERVSRPHDGSHRRECDDTAVPRSRLRDRHGRRAEGDGARGPRVAFLRTARSRMRSRAAA